MFVVVLIVGFSLRQASEPRLPAGAPTSSQVSDRAAGATLFAVYCSSCHGEGAVGGSASVLNAKEFLHSTTDRQIRERITRGSHSVGMPALGSDFGGPLTGEQVHQIATYLRSLAPNAPSVPAWRSGQG